MNDEVTPNPSVETTPSRRVTRETRIPMSIPVRKLEAPEIPGYHTHWFLTKNLPRAIAAGYEQVLVSEMPINQLNPANAPNVNGSSGLGAGVEVTEGIDEHGHAAALHLMKIPQEWYDDDRAALERRNADIIRTIFKGEVFLGAEGGGDRSNMYTSDELNMAPKTKGLFNRPPRKTRT